MDSEATLPPPEQGNPAPSSGSIVAPAPPSPGEGGDCKAASSSSEPECCFLSGEDEPEFETASERPLAAEPDEEGGPEDEFDAPATEAEDSPSPGLGEGGDGAVEENGHDDDEKEADAVEVRGVSEGVGTEAERLDAAPGGDANLEVNPDGLLNGVGNEKALLESLVGDEADQDGVPGGNGVAGVGSGDGTASGVEKNVPQGAGEGKIVDSGVGDEGVAAPVAGNGAGLDVAELQFIGEAPEKPALGEESEIGAQLGADAGDNPDMVTTAVTLGNQELQPSEAEESIGHTKEEEENALVSSEMQERVEKVEKQEMLKVVDGSLDSGDAKNSSQKISNLDSSAVVDEIVPSESEGEGDGIEQATAESQLNSRELEGIIDANGADVFSAGGVEFQSLPAEDSLNEQAGLDIEEVPMVAHVADSGNATVIPAPNSDLKHIDDGSEAAAGEESMGQNVGAGVAVGEAAATAASIFDQPANVAVLGSSETADRIVKELTEGSLGASSSLESSPDHENQIDGQIVSDSDEDVETDEEGEGKELLFDSAALTALLKAATSNSADGTVTVSGPDATRTFSIDRPAGLGSSASSLRPAPARTIRPNLFYPSDLATAGEPEDNVDEEGKKLQVMVDQIRVKFLRLVHRLGHSPEDRVAAQVLYRLGLAEGIRHGRQLGRAFNLENAKKKALQLEEDGKEPLNFSCNILIMGKTGVGKSATINSIFGEEKVPTNAFEPATPSVKEIIGTVDGIKIRVADTPGLKTSVVDQTVNNRILASIKKYTNRCPPDIVLYVDRLDTQTWNFNDLPLLRSITSILGSSIWFNAIVALTHAASAPPDGPSGSPLSYEVFIDQRSRIVQHAIRQAAGDMRLMNPVALVENHPSCRRNREGQRVLPNGQNWRTQLLLLCYSSKILSEANSLLKLQDPSPGKLFGFRVRSPPLPFLLSSLLQSRAHPKLSTDQGGDNYDSDMDLGDLSDSDQEEEEDQYDQLPPFKPLRKAQIAKLTKEQRKAYFDEYDYRVKLLQKKQWKEEIRRLKEMKKTGKSGQDESGYGDMADDFDQDGAPAAVPVPLPDMVLPPSFDSENPAYRYRFLEPTSQLLARPVLDTHGWDHDCGYDGVSLEENLAIAGQYPAAFTVQVTKDKKEFSVHLDSSISAKHGGNGSTLAGFDIQSVGKQLAYILRCETKFKNLKKNKTTAGMSVTFLGENIATGLKVEDQLLIGKRLGLVASSGAVRAQGDVAYGANLEVHLRDKDFPVGQDVSTLGLSLMRWRSDLALGANLQSQFSIGRSSKMAVRVGLNNKLSGQITVRTSTSEQLHIALLGILPLAVSIYRSIWSGEAY